MNPIIIISGDIADDLGGQALQAIAVLQGCTVQAGVYSKHHLWEKFTPSALALTDALSIVRALLAMPMHGDGSAASDVLRAALAQYERRAEDQAMRLVNNEVCYCVSALITALWSRDWHGGNGEGIDPEGLSSLMRREADADDYREAARYSENNDLREVMVQADALHWKWRSGPHDVWSAGNDSAVQAWREAFAELGEDDPAGTECLEHWLVTDWLADALEAQGEAVARDIAGLTIWGRCTSGQSIHADAVMRTIARNELEA